MLRIGDAEIMFSKDNSKYYEVHVFLNALSDLKWVNNFAENCHYFNSKPNDSFSHNNEIEICYSFKRRKHLNRFIQKLKRYIMHQVNS